MKGRAHTTIMRAYKGIRSVAGYLQIGGTLLVLAFALGLWQPLSLAEGDPKAPQYKVEARPAVGGFGSACWPIDPTPRAPQVP